MTESTAVTASLREALGRPEEGLIERVSAARRNRGDTIHRARRIVVEEQRPSDDELAMVLTGFMLRRH